MLFKEWSRETLLESWIKDAITCCEKCGVIPPMTLCSDHDTGPTIDPLRGTMDHDLGSPSISFTPSLSDAEVKGLWLLAESDNSLNCSWSQSDLMLNFYSTTS